MKIKKILSIIFIIMGIIVLSMIALLFFSNAKESRYQDCKYKCYEVGSTETGAKDCIRDKCIKL